MSSNVKKKRPKRRDPSRPLWILREPSSSLFPSKGELLNLFAVVAIATSVAISCNYAAVIFNRQPKPFCDSDGSFDELISDVCERCPDNGLCSSGKLECLHGYKKQGRKCIEDGEIHRTAKQFLDWVEDHVCNAYAQVLCNGAGKIWFDEADIMKILDECKLWQNIGLNEDTLMFAKRKVMEDLGSSLEKRTLGSEEYKCPDARVETYKPLLCSVRQWIYGHIYLVAAVLAFGLGLVRVSRSIRRKQYLSTRAEQLYEQVCEILEENAMMVKTMNNEGEPWVVASWLRDHLLLPRERKDVMLWKKVEEFIREDSRIDQYPRLIKGESKIVLEWQVDGSLSSKMKTKRAVSRMKLGSHSDLPFNHQHRNANKPEPNPLTT